MARMTGFRPNCRITIERLDDQSRNALNEVVPIWVEVMSTAARIADTRVQDTESAGAERAIREARFLMRRHAGSLQILPSDRLRRGGEIWAIKALRDLPTAGRGRIEVVAAFEAGGA